MTRYVTRRNVFIAAGVVVVLAVVGVIVGPWIYARAVAGDEPPPLSLPTGAGTGSAVLPDDLDGEWVVSDGSVAGYRVDEVLRGEHVTAVGRTDQVEGGLTLTGTVVSGVQVTVDMASVQTDESQRDAQYRSNIMATSTYPTSTFVQTSDVTLPATEGQFTVPITGDLTVRGQTRSVTVELDVQLSGAVNVVGAIPVVFADYGVPAPNVLGITVEDHGVIEFLLVLTHA